MNFKKNDLLEDFFFTSAYYNPIRSSIVRKLLVPQSSSQFLTHGYVDIIGSRFPCFFNCWERMAIRKEQ